MPRLSERDSPPKSRYLQLSLPSYPWERVGTDMNGSTSQSMVELCIYGLSPLKSKYNLFSSLPLSVCYLLDFC